ncbi:MAG: discoidin domain-containing protein [Eubacterium sp.]|nr:discoidin domain-containing protein [Eubacterium sp.]
MRKGKLFTNAKKTLSAFLATAMVVGLMPAQSFLVKADDTPYVVSTGRTVYASSSVGNSDPAYVADGTLGTRWESEWGNQEEWIYVDLGKVTQITGVKLYWEGAYAKKYRIQTSNDEENWTTVDTNNNCTGGNEERNVTTSARYVRLYMTEKQLPAYGYSLYEFEIYGLNGITKPPVNYGTNIAEGKNVSASSLRDIWWMYDSNGVIDQSSVLAQNAVDGNKNTYWTSGEADNQWLTVDLGRNYTIGRVIIDWASDAGKMYDIQVSTNGNDWTTLYRETKGSGFHVANVELYANARYVRMYGFTRVESGSGFSIYEMKVYEYKNGDPHVTHNIPELPQSRVVSDGKGTYLANSMYNEKAKLPIYKTDDINTPVASNDWWQSMLINKFGNTLCMLPFKARYSTKGLGILTATEGWLPDMGPTDVNVSVNSETENDFYIQPENFDTTTACDKVSGYSDFAVSAQLCDDNHVAMTSTFVKGSPYIFTEYGDTQTITLVSANISSIFDGNGNEILTTNLSSLTADHIGIEVTDNDNKDRTKTAKSYYCLTVPANTVFKKIGKNIRITFPGNNGYMSIGTMNSKSQIDTFFHHGYAFVTNTAVTYDYNDGNAKITSNYTATTTLKRAGFDNNTFMCMLPHQWKNSNDDNNAFTTYTSVRGDLKTVNSNSFATVSDFAGLLPTFALPRNAEFDGEAVLGYLSQLEDATKNLNPAGDAYWEGKNLHPLGMGVLMADQLGETELRDVFLKRIKKILVNWFTYDGQNDISYFIYNQNWGTLFYEQSEFGANAAICDHHFTYGYFMFAATVLATYDEQFYNDYKGMIELMIRDYANPSDNDSEYCRFRAYDMYEGHSWAGGYADNDSGNNQESASESLFSWVSMYLWGVLTENDTYRDAGVFGFTNEMEAVEQYWFDYDKDNWIDAWPYDVVGQVYGGINFYGTFFGGQPLYVYGIQWLPISEYLTYYGMNQTRAAEIYAGLENDTDVALAKAIQVAQNEGKTQAEIDKMVNEYPHQDTGWQHITWPFLSQTNPTLAMQKFLANDTKVQRTDTANTYWFISAMKELGVKTTEIVATGDCSAAVYYNKDTRKYTATVWNPTNETKVVGFKVNGTQKGTATIGAKALVSFEVYKDRNFNIQQAETPEISVPTGTYDDTQYVTLSSSTPGATIHYTTDGSMPNTSSPVYDGSTFAVSSTATVKAIAVKDQYITSAMASSTITVDGSDVSKDTNIALGKNVTVTSAENASVGGDKLVDNNKTTRWSSQFNDNESAVIDLGQNYTINKVTLAWEASYAKEYKIQVSTNGTNYTTVYENNNGKGGDEEIVFNATDARYVKIQGVKRALAYGYSLWEVGVYEAAKVAQPTFSKASGTYSGTQNISISSATKGVEIRYTTDGSTPNQNSKLYVPTVKISNTTTLKAVAYRKGMIASDVATATYTIDGSGQPEPPVQPPVEGNLAEGKTTTSSGDENGAMASANAVDGNAGTRWSSNFSDDAWVTVDLGATYSISRVVLTWEAAYGKAYKIQVSTNGNDWTTVKTLNNQNGGTDEIDFTATDARYVRMQGVERALPYGYSLWEMEVYGEGNGSGGSGSGGSTNGANVALNKTVTATGAENDAMAAANAVDGNSGTRWSSNFADDASMTVDLGQVYSINRVVILWEAAYGKAYKIQVSTNGSDWTTVANMSNQDGGTDPVTFNTVNARYVKMQGVERALPYGYSIWEFGVYGE